MLTPYKINCLLFAYLRKSSRIFFVSNYLLNILVKHATKSCTNTLCAIAQKMKIPKDNLTPKQQRNTYLKIFSLVIIICAFLFYKNSINENREELLSNNTEYTFCRIVGSSSYKTLQNHLEYSVSGKKYETRPLSSRIFNIGEFYEIKYSKSNPEISEVDYTKPIIFDKNEFDSIEAIIIKVYESERLSVLSYKYEYGTEEYEREIILEKIGKLKKENQITILVNKNNPKISYLEGQFNAE